MATNLDLRTQREAVVKAHFQAEAVDHDVAATVATFAKPRYEVPAAGAIVDGADGVHDFVQQILTSFPDLRLQQQAVHHAEGAVIVEVKFGGTQRGEWAGVEPTGKQNVDGVCDGSSVNVDGVCIFIFDGSDLICEKVYFDNATILRQIGALV